VNVHPEVLDLA
jgi:hypothetical protein